jgi:hypothetical protein
MVHTARAPLAGDALSELPEPTCASLLRRGVPLLAIESAVPVAVFYGAWKVSGLATAIIAGTLVSLAIADWQMRTGRGGGVAAVTAIFLVIQALVGLAAHSATVYLAQPVVLSACWSLAYFASVFVGRPLVGVFAQVWYPFPPAFRASAPYRREFGMQSIVWGVYCLARAMVRLVVLLGSGVGSFLLVSLLTGTPILVLLVFWGLWHARRTFSQLDDVPAEASSTAPAR